MRSRWWRWLRIGIILVLALLGSAVAWEYYARWEARRDLDARIAELDATDPRWRLADVEADRRQVPPAENSALIVKAAHALLPRDWQSWNAVNSLISDAPPVFELRPDDAKKLTETLQSAVAALTKARELERLPLGRHRLDYAADFLSTLMADQQNVRQIAALLHADIAEAVHRRDMVQAWHSHRALLNSGRSLGDEPLLISMLVRMAIDAIAIGSLEHALAQGEMTPAHLEERQQALAEESAVPMFSIGIRGERAGMDHLLTNIETGKIGLVAVLEHSARPNRERTAAWWDSITEFFAYSMVLRSHATMLDYFDQMVHAAEQPPTERYKALAEIEDVIRADFASLDRTRILARLLLPAVLRIAQAEQRNHSHLACAVAGLAAERYRLRSGRWPESLDELVVAGLLPEAPLDRFAAGPLRLRRTSDGLVIYSIGRDGTNDGTGLDTPDTFDADAIRVEFRLWEPVCRRQSPPPVAVPKEPPDLLPPPPPEPYVPPRGYVCYRALGPITIDGKLSDPAWQAAPWTDDFVDIQGDRRQRPRLRTRVKMLWDKDCFYIGAELQEPHVQASFTKHDSFIFHEDNDFEVFIDPDGTNHNYIELEMNALNTTWDLLLKKPYRDGGPAVHAFEIEGLRTAVHIDGTLNDPRDTDRGWTIEIALPWKALGKQSKRPVPPEDGAQWRVNFSRVEWLYEIVEGKYRRVTTRPEDNWVWSPQGTINMHRPERWGYVQFTTAAPGKGEFRPDLAGPARHLLHRIYEAQAKFHKENDRYAATLDELGLADLTHVSLARPPQLALREGGFHATVAVRLPDRITQRWRIREDSLLLPVTGDD
jgi:hypothetical protein